MAAADLSWVPKSCRLSLSWEAREGAWNGSLRLTSDYLGYLVSDATGTTPEAAIEEVKRQYVLGMEKLLEWSEGEPKRSYFRVVKNMEIVEERTDV